MFYQNFYSNLANELECWAKIENFVFYCCVKVNTSTSFGTRNSLQSRFIKQFIKKVIFLNKYYKLLFLRGFYLHAPIL